MNLLFRGVFEQAGIVKTVTIKHSPIKKRPWSTENSVCVLYSVDGGASATGPYPTWYSHLHPSPASACTAIRTTPNAIWLHEVRVDQKTECRDVTITGMSVDCGTASFTPRYTTCHCLPPNCCCHRGGHTIVIYTLVSAIYFTPHRCPRLDRLHRGASSAPQSVNSQRRNDCQTPGWWRTPLFFFGAHAKTRFVCRPRLFRMAFGYEVYWIF